MKFRKPPSKALVVLFLVRLCRLPWPLSVLVHVRTGPRCLRTRLRKRRPSRRRRPPARALRCPPELQHSEFPCTRTRKPLASCEAGRPENGVCEAGFRPVACSLQFDDAFRRPVESRDVYTVFSRRRLEPLFPKNRFLRTMASLRTCSHAAEVSSESWAPPPAAWRTRPCIRSGRAVLAERGGTDCAWNGGEVLSDFQLALFSGNGFVLTFSAAFRKRVCTDNLQLGAVGEHFQGSPFAR